MFSLHHPRGSDDGQMNWLHFLSHIGFRVRVGTRVGNRDDPSTI